MHNQSSSPSSSWRTTGTPRTLQNNSSESTGAKSAFLWQDPDQDFWYVAFLWSKSFFRSVIYRIHSGQGFIGSLIWVICKRIIGSMIRRIPLGEGSEINHCAQRFCPWIAHILRIWDPLPRSVDNICVVVSGLLKFKHVSAYYWVKVIRKFEWVVLNFVAVLTQNCRITPPNTRACNLQPPRWNRLFCNIAWDVISDSFKFAHLF